MTEAVLGVLGAGALATVDERGAISASGVELDWWVGADDRWHVPAEEPSTRRRRLGAAPVWETTVRVPGGEVAHRAYGVTASDGAVVAVDVENRSPAPLTIGLVLRVGGGTSGGRRARRCASTARSCSRCSAVPRRWATGASTAQPVMAGEAREGSVEPFDGPGELALLFPVPHRTAVRAALGVGADRVERRVHLPAAEAVVRGLGRGSWNEACGPSFRRPSASWSTPARADLLLAPTRCARRRGARGLGLRRRGRRRLGAARMARRGGEPAAASSPTIRGRGLRAVDSTREPARFLAELRAVLVRRTRRADRRCCPASRPTGSASR